MPTNKILKQFHREHMDTYECALTLREKLMKHNSKHGVNGLPINKLRQYINHDPQVIVNKYPYTFTIENDIIKMI